MRYLLSFSLFLLIFQACQPTQKNVIVSEAQGTYYRVVYYHQNEVLSQAETDSMLKAFDQSASNYAPQSIISKVNRNEEVELDKSFTEVFELSERISKETEGLFDITVRPLVEMYGFGKTEEISITDRKRDSVLEFIGYQKVRIEDKRIVKQDPRLQLDFNAVAQGYSVDYLLDYLVSKGLKVCMVDIGGEVRAYGMKPGGEDWRVGIELPEEGAGYGQNIEAVVKLNRKAMATSGNYRKFHEKDGIKYVHTISPVDGSTVQSQLLSASILAPTAGEADAYATACMVMGLEKSKAFIEANPELEAYFIYFDEKGEYAHYVSDGMKERLVEMKN